jgi:hypothetical protein
MATNEETQIEMMKWSVERWEVANLSFIDRALSLVGFSVVELALLVQLVTSKIPLSRGESLLLEVTVVGILLSIGMFFYSLLPKSDGLPHVNRDYLGKSQDEILKMLSEAPDPQKSKKEKRHSQETLQFKENTRRFWPLVLGMVILGCSQIVLSFLLGVHFKWL